MNRTVLTAALAFLLSGSLAFAQAPAPDAQPPAQQSGAPARTHSPNPHRQAMRMAKQLNLSPDQTTQLEPILADRDQQIAALRADTSIPPKAVKKQLRAIRQNTRQQLSTVLSPDQLQQLRSMQHSRKGQPQPAATPSA